MQKEDSAAGESPSSNSLRVTCHLRGRNGHDNMDILPDRYHNLLVFIGYVLYVVYSIYLFLQVHARNTCTFLARGADKSWFPTYMEQVQ